MFYVLDQNKNAVKVSDLPSDFFVNIEDRRVALDKGVGDYDVSTVFLGIDHDYFSSGPPMLFETMVFFKGTYNECNCYRYSTWEEAEECHKQIVGFLESGGSLSNLHLSFTGGADTCDVVNLKPYAERARLILDDAGK